MNSKECANEVGRFTKYEDEAWCEGFLEAWNAQAALKAETQERIEELQTLLEETLKQLASMDASFKLLADMVREGR
jgi:hypothetical protein